MERNLLGISSFTQQIVIGAVIVIARSRLMRFNDGGWRRPALKQCFGSKRQMKLTQFKTAGVESAATRGLPWAM